MSIELTKESRTNYHGNVASICEFFGWLDVQEGCELICMFEVQLVEAADASEENTVLELLHVASGLAHHGWVGWRIIFER